jgi:hypothetical protein
MRETSKQYSETGKTSTKKKRAMQRAVRWAKRRRVKETRDTASGAAGKMSTRERKKRCSQRRGGHAASERKKRVMLQAAGGRVTERINLASSTASEQRK